MVSTQQGATKDDVRAAYTAVVDYHNNLVHMRFTVAGLFLAANGFLASGFFQSSVCALARAALPVLGMVVAAICWLLEVRTYQLLENLGKRGHDLEESLGLQHSQGFFSLMEHQSIAPRLLLTRLRLPANRVVRYLVSHSFGLGLLYTLIGLFWLVMLVVSA
jgi:hypothetical protein